MNNSAKQPETTTVLGSDGPDDFQATTTLSKTADTRSKNTRIGRMLTAVSMTVLALAASFGFVAATGEAAYASVTVRPAVHVIVRKPLNNSWGVIQPAVHGIVRKPMNGNRGTPGNRLRTRASEKGGGAHPQNSSWI